MGGYYVCVIAAVVFVGIAALTKYKSGDINYYNADATWHTLLTVESYNETPILQHLFLPIVSLGNETDKWIPWGATIPDEQGNYYYTSFSPAGYFLPWLFFRMLHLPVNERSLYVFNTCLFAISAALWGVFLKWIFQENIISLLGTMLYVFSPELLHGMGIVYWHQSVLQVTLTMQVMAYYRYRQNLSRAGRGLFYLLSFINPYIEWTGYIANCGYVLAEFAGMERGKIKDSIKRIAGIGICTVMSFSVFALHYLLRVNRYTFFEALKSRFMARNVTTDTEISSVFGGYFKSFAYVWVILAILLIWNIWKYKKIEISHGLMMEILIFPLLENVIMKQHALSYSYDRMKGIFFLSFLCCECISTLMVKSREKKNTGAILSAMVMMACLLNMNLYSLDGGYMWDAGYRSDNEKLAGYINEKYESSVLGIEGVSVRGYANILFGRGIYEWLDMETLKQKAIERNQRYAVMITVEDAASWNMYDLSGATIYDTVSGTQKAVLMMDGFIEEE